MGDLRVLLFIASGLALLVVTPIEAQKSHSEGERADGRKVEEAQKANGEHEQAVEHSKDEEIDHLQDHKDDNGHKDGTDDHVQGHDKGADNEDEHDTISALVNLDEPPSSDISETKQEDGDHPLDKDEDHKSADHDKGKMKCCLMSLHKPFSASSRCSCTQWLKHALRHSIFLRPLLEFLRNSLPTLSRKRHHRIEEGADQGEDSNDTEEEQSEDQSDLRRLGFIDIGYGGGGYYGGYPGYWGGYPGLYGYPGLGWAVRPGFGLGVSF